MQKEMQKFGWARKHKERMKNMDTLNKCGQCTLCKLHSLAMFTGLC